MFKITSRNLVHLLLLVVLFAGAGSALAQFDVRYEEDVDYLDEDSSAEDTEVEEVDDEEEADEEPAANIKRPAVETCSDLPESIVIFGYAAPMQCQQVNMAGIGRMDLINLGIADALDIWGSVPGSVDVCFQQAGYLVFLDAAYAPRLLQPLLSFERDGMTCGRINRAGTVVLLHEPMIFDEPIVPSNSVPVNNCVIKLVETLFLRAAPDDEIIGLVWQNSEVPVYEINGYWYKIEFEGVTGYISRLYHNVLSGGCA